jgi:transcription initiation factor TFIIF subunit beta
MSEVKKEPNSPGFEDDVSLSPSPPPSQPNGLVKQEDDDDDDNNNDDDDDQFEDSLDLDVSDTGSKVWLVRLPKFLLERWKDLETISGSELGKVRIRDQKGNEPWKVKLLLNDTPETADIPHEYDVSLVKQVVDNTYVFTEKDLANYKKDSHRNSPRPSSSSSATNGKMTTPKSVDQTKFTPYVKTIPKRTALVGTACHECLVMPSLKDQNYSKVVNQRKQMESNAQRAKVTFLNEMPGVNAASIGQSLRGKGSAFMRAQKKDTSKTGDGKATRIPKNELLDLLFKLFEEYDYWSMKGLRDRTKQPETYLKEVLETMAVLIKKGPYSMKYSLKPEFKQIKGMGGSLSAYMEKSGEQQSTSEISESIDEKNDQEDEDEDVEMETIF